LSKAENQRNKERSAYPDVPNTVTIKKPESLS